ncbi:MAG: hypothetical protein U1E45_08645 [Geminicoccaceae bacterium]
MAISAAELQAEIVYPLASQTPRGGEDFSETSRRHATLSQVPSPAIEASTPEREKSASALNALKRAGQHSIQESLNSLDRGMLQGSIRTVLAGSYQDFNAASLVQANQNQIEPSNLSEAARRSA